jgi:hypothetical protein
MKMTKASSSVPCVPPVSLLKPLITLPLGHMRQLGQKNKKKK